MLARGEASSNTDVPAARQQRRGTVVKGSRATLSRRTCQERDESHVKMSSIETGPVRQSRESGRDRTERRRR
jgi:hypothetical protein